jgi:hypothetical protein
MFVGLPCPSLIEWLPTLLESPAFLVRDTLDRRLDGALAQIRQLSDDPSQRRTELAEARTLVRCADTETELPDSFVATLEPGMLIIELAVRPARRIRSLLGFPTAQSHARDALGRFCAWSTRGADIVGQWEAVDPPDVLVTVARWRGSGSLDGARPGSA